MRRIARAATSAREFHSGEPGEASGATFAGSKTGELRGGSRGVRKRTLFTHRVWADNLVDSRYGSRSRGVKPSVESWIARLQREITAFTIFDHASNLPWPKDSK